MSKQPTYRKVEYKNEMKFLIIPDKTLICPDCSTIIDDSEMVVIAGNRCRRCPTCGLFHLYLNEYYQSGLRRLFCNDDSASIKAISADNKSIKRQEQLAEEKRLNNRIHHVQRNIQKIEDEARKRDKNAQLEQKRVNIDYGSGPLGHGSKSRKRGFWS